MTDERPLFIPLKKEWFEKFARGEKNCEYRQYGARWNLRTCRPGRQVVLSCGYGKTRRLHGVVADAVMMRCMVPDYVREIFPEGVVIRIDIANIKEAK